MSSLIVIEDWASERCRAGRPKFVRWFCTLCSRLGPALPIKRNRHAAEATAQMGGDQHIRMKHRGSP